MPEARPINQAELTELQRAEAEIPASPPPAAAPRDPTAPTSGAPGAAASPAPGAPAAASLCSPRSSLAAAGTGGRFGYHYLTVGRFLVTTDDAYVQAYNTTLAAKVAGYVASVPVTDNTYVRAGDVIATIDDGDYRLAVDTAREKVTTQKATVAHGASNRRPRSGCRAGAHAACLRASGCPCRAQHGARQAHRPASGAAA